MNGYLYEDMIIGEYQYIENGVEKINTLNGLSVNHSNGGKYSISGNIIIAGQVDNDCLPNEKHCDWDCLKVQPIIQQT